MANRIKLDEEKLMIFKNAIAAMAEFRRVFHKDLQPSFIAEIYAAEELGLKINLNITEPGFDAIDSSGKRYQIKYRSLRTQNADFNNFDFDYLILVNLDDHYRLIGMWRITADQARKIFAWRKKYLKYQATQTKVKNNAERVR